MQDIIYFQTRNKEKRNIMILSFPGKGGPQKKKKKVLKMVREADTAKRELHWSCPLSVALKGSGIIFLPILVKKANSEVRLQIPGPSLKPPITAGREHLPDKKLTHTVHPGMSPKHC